MAPKLPSIPNFVPTNDQVLIREPSSSEPISKDDPDMILIFSWGDGLPKHVAKYADGYNALYPAARQIIILGPISKVFFARLSARVEDMLPVLNALEEQGILPLKAADMMEKKMLVHTMSNTGGSNYAAMLHAYREKHGQPFPHDLVVFDSTPGSPVFSWKRLGQWSRAMSMGIANFFPWPEFITRGIMGFATICVYIAGHLSGEEPAGVFAVRVMDDETYVSKDVKKMYLYSREDDLISSEDVEMYIAHAKEVGYETRLEVFKGSPHVGHMRMHPEQYWTAVRDAWSWAMGA